MGSWGFTLTWSYQPAESDTACYASQQTVPAFAATVAAAEHLEFPEPSVAASAEVAAVVVRAEHAGYQQIVADTPIALVLGLEQSPQVQATMTKSVAVGKRGPVAVLQRQQPGLLDAELRLDPAD